MQNPVPLHHQRAGRHNHGNPETLPVKLPEIVSRLDGKHGFPGAGDCLYDSLTAVLRPYGEAFFLPFITVFQLHNMPSWLASASSL